MNDFNIIIADDHRLVADGLEMFIEERNLGTVKVKVINGKELLQYLNDFKTDLIILDINMPILNGLEAAGLIKIKYPDIKILIVSQYDSKEIIRKVYDLGVDGYMSKIFEHKDMVKAIQKIKSNEKVFPDWINDPNTKPKKFLFVGNEKFNLSEREYEIVLLIANGLTTKEIASKLFLSELTIETHRKNIGRKTGATSSAATIKFVIEHNLPFKP